MNILISACLLGAPCRYDGTGKLEPALERLRAQGHTLVPVCPEVLGGLPTPRPPAERLPLRGGAGPENCPGTRLHPGGPQGALPLLRPRDHL